MMEPDYTLAEAKAAILALAADLPRGSLAQASIESDDSLNRSTLVRGYIRIDGAYHFTHADTLREVIDGLRTWWSEHEADLHADLVKRMALKIIEITAEFGECSDAALRAEFDAREVREYGAAAVERANEMADAGPFSIVLLSGANAEAA